MSDLTPELNLVLAVDGDDLANYLDLDTGPSLRTSLKTVDGLFNSSTGHTHNGAHQGGPLSSIPGSAIADGSITSAKITDGTVTGTDIAAGTITGANIAASTITSSLIADGTIQGADITNGAIGTAQLAAGAVTSAIIADGTIQSGDIAAGAVGTTQLAASPMLSSPTLSNPTLNGTVSGAPTWASPQSFPAGDKVGGSLTIANANAASSDWKIYAGSLFYATGVPNGGVAQIPISFSGFTATPVVVASLGGISGGQATPGIYITQVSGVSASGATVCVYNNSGGGQSFGVGWIAFGH